ncbi:lytic transglycosylase domain-containing protein [Acinetobacter sp. WZC-1]|uniref:lytic transglycosylase domain-containing protein n=1 Tax=Acinetobacter sp. WZC-1 TaxID=3459034 RepID=UPI00403D86FF
MKILFTCLLRSFLGYISLVCIIPHSHAGQIYVYQDKNGSTLLTNRKSSDQSLQRIKVTYYPDSNIHSYSNWGKSESSVLPSYSKNKNAYDHLIRQAAQTHGISEGLIKAVMHTESGFNLNARSPVGAQGLMQLMPATARRFNVANAYDPQQNIFGGAKYLGWLLRRFNGNTQLALAAYNAGEGNVDKYGGIPPFRETQDYVRRVTSRLNNLYSNGISSSSNDSSALPRQVIAQSVSDGDADRTASATPVVTAAKYSPRPIIVASDGTFTDAPSRSYSTSHATASARITISN